MGGMGGRSSKHQLGPDPHLGPPKVTSADTDFSCQALKWRFLPLWRRTQETYRNISRAAKRGGFKRGDFPIWTCPSCFVLFCPFWDFPDFSDLLGDGSGIFPISPFPLSRPIKSTYEEQSRKDPRHNLDLSQRKWETPGFGSLPV